MYAATQNRSSFAQTLIWRKQLRNLNALLVAGLCRPRPRNVWLHWLARPKLMSDRITLFPRRPTPA